jgi:hypothetical protein
LISLKRSFIKRDDPLYKPFDREKIIYFLLERYPRLLTNSAQVSQIYRYIFIELDYIYRLKDFYRLYYWAVDEIIILNEKKEYLENIRTILSESEYFMGTEV